MGIFVFMWVCRKIHLWFKSWGVHYTWVFSVSSRTNALGSLVGSRGGGEVHEQARQAQSDNRYITSLAATGKFSATRPENVLVLI